MTIQWKTYTIVFQTEITWEIVQLCPGKAIFYMSSLYIQVYTRGSLENQPLNKKSPWQQIKLRLRKKTHTLFLRYIWLTELEAF